MSAPQVPTLALELNHPDRDRLRRVGMKVRKRLAANKAARRIAVDKAELWAVPKFFDELECGRLITMIDQVAEPSETYEFTRDVGFRTSYSGTVDWRDPFVLGLRKRIDNLLGIDWTHGEVLQGQRYAAGQYFKPHADWFESGSKGWAVEKDNGGQRAFTAMVYLNDVVDGGETDFPNLGIAVEPRVGTLLAWNNADPDGVPNPFTVHAGNPVGSGLKYVVTRWYRVRPTLQPF
jgi:prolyl 4-hydroxylase